MAKSNGAKSGEYGGVTDNLESKKSNFQLSRSCGVERGVILVYFQAVYVDASSALP